jgi:hypothetical protein
MSAQTASPSASLFSGSRCGICRAPTTVQRISPLRPGFEHWTLRCTSCGHIHQMQVVSNRAQSDALDWFDSPLNPLR